MLPSAWRARAAVNKMDLSATGNTGKPEWQGPLEFRMFESMFAGGREHIRSHEARLRIRRDGQDMAEANEKRKFVGMACLFDEKELKGLFLRYIHLIIIVEISLLLIMLAGYAAGKTGAFPTRLYFFLAFGIPLATTFLLGVVVQAFDHYVAGERKAADRYPPDPLRPEPQRPETSRNALWRRVANTSHPVKIALLLSGAYFLYHLDGLLGFMVRAGSEAYHSLILLTVFLIGGATLIGLFWLVSAYRLKRNQMEHRYRYRQEILERLDLMVLDDDTIVDRSGRIVALREALPLQTPSLTLPDEATPPEDLETESRSHERAPAP